MAAKDTIKLNVNNLVPDEKYVIQVRAVANGEESDWSQKLHFKTNSDKQANGGPTVPQNVTWESTSDALVASWDAVTENVNGTAAKVAKYEIELSGGVLVNQSAVLDSGGDRVERAFSVAEIYSKWQGAIPDVISMRVRTQNSGGSQSDWTAPLSVNVGKPDPPTDAVPPPTAKSVIDAVALNWTPPANPANVAGYVVYVGLTPEFVAAGTNRIYQGATPSAVYNSSTYVTHYFKIRAYSLFGKESDDLLAEGMPRSPFGSDWTPPPVPSNIDADFNRTGGVATGTLTWDWVDDDEFDIPLQHFDIRFKRPSETIWQSVTAPSADRTVTVTLPRAYSTYDVQIASVDAVGNYSAYVPATPLQWDGGIPGPPPQVTGVTSEASLDSITVSWVSPHEEVTNEGTFEVQIAKNVGMSTDLRTYTVSGGDLQISLVGLDYLTQYWFRVRALDPDGDPGAWSATATNTTIRFPQAAVSDGIPPASSPAAVVTPGIGYLSVNWVASSNTDTTTYEVHISKTNGFAATSDATKVAEINGTMVILRKDATGAALNYTDTYYVRIRAKDVDGIAAPGTQASGVALQAKTYDIESISVAQLTAGTVAGEEIVLGAGGIFRSEEQTGEDGFTMTHNSIIIKGNSTVSAGALESGSTLTGALIVTGSMKLNNPAYIKSNNYSDGVTPMDDGIVRPAAGFRMDSAGLDMRTGTLWADVIKGGRITGANIFLGAGGAIILDSATGLIKSNNYNGDSDAGANAGWRISNTGIEMWDSSSKIRAEAFRGGTFSGGAFIVDTGGSIRSENYVAGTSGWIIDKTQFETNLGTIRGATVITDQLYSSGTVDDGGGVQRRRFDINSGGYALFTGARIYGNTLVSEAAHHRLQSANWVSGTQGWQINGVGYAEMNNMRVGGAGTDYVIMQGLGSNAFIRIVNGSTAELKGDLKSMNNGIELAARFGPSIMMDGGLARVTGDFQSDGYCMAYGAFNYPSAGQTGNREVYWDNNGKLSIGAVIGSSQRYKENIKPLEASVEAILSLEPKSFNYKKQFYREGDRDTVVGFIAEEAEAAGLERWVLRNEDGEVENFDYKGWPVALQKVAQYQQKEIVELKARLAVLEEALDKKPKR